MTPRDDGTNPNQALAKEISYSQQYRIRVGGELKVLILLADIAVTRKWLQDRSRSGAGLTALDQDIKIIIRHKPRTRRRERVFVTAA